MIAFTESLTVKKWLCYNKESVALCNVYADFLWCVEELMFLRTQATYTPLYQSTFTTPPYTRKIVYS